MDQQDEDSDQRGEYSNQRDEDFNQRDDDFDQADPKVEYLIEDPLNNVDQDEDPFGEYELPNNNSDAPDCSTLDDHTINTFSNQTGFATDDSTRNAGDLTEEAEEEAVQQKHFFFLANYFVKKYTRQKNGVCINEKTNVPEKVFGDSLSEVFECIWNFVKPHLCREIDVNEVDGIKVSWSEKEDPDIRDIHNFIYLRDAKRKTMIKLDQLREGKIMLNWREKVINVFAFAYSQSVSSVAIWEEVNKCLLQPSETDRAGAPSNVNLDELIQDLKEKNSHLKSHDSGWVQWANWIHASPAHLQAGLMTQLPPVEMRGMFSSLPTSEGSRSECVREGLVVAQNIVDNLTTGVQVLCDKSEQLMSNAFEVKLLAQGLNEKLSMCRDMLKGMQTSMAPQESTLSQRVAEEVGDVMDVDHA